MGHDDEVVLARVRISTLKMIIEDIQVHYRSDIRSLLDAIHHNQDIKRIIPPTSPRDNETHIGSPMPLSPSSSVGSSSLIRLTTPPPDYPFDESIFAELDNSLWIIPMAPNKTSTSATPTMTQAAIRKLITDSVATALEA
uniref:Reverse transcriptase domain-containing protein n=1 Tax=Tanacetum cinerariifolium TaxID=118510 RepID=A0A6L2KG76_TANCI|nr:hypothetical protein [Tanacetum cinerariifolium]